MLLGSSPNLAPGDVLRHPFSAAVLAQDWYSSWVDSELGSGVACLPRIEALKACPC
jgi:hypothetical protein